MTGDVIALLCPTRKRVWVVGMWESRLLGEIPKSRWKLLCRFHRDGISTPLSASTAGRLAIAIRSTSLSARVLRKGDGTEQSTLGNTGVDGQDVPAGIRPMLVQLTTFSGGHTITLRRMIYGVLSLPSSVVEPLIAFLDRLSQTEVQHLHGPVLAHFDVRGLFASRSKRARRSGSDVNASGSTLSATSRSSVMSRGCQTSPIRLRRAWR